MNVNVNLMEENVTQINGGKIINVSMWVQKIHICEIGYLCNAGTCSYQKERYLASIMDDSAIICVFVMNYIRRWKKI